MKQLVIMTLLCFIAMAGWARADCMDSLWVIGPGSLNSDFGTGVVSTGDGNAAIGGYYDVVGITQGYGWLIKLNPTDGSQYWSRTYSAGSGQSVFLDVARTNDGGFIGGGWNRVPVTNDQQLWLLRTDANGDSLWSRSFGHEFANQGRAVVQATDGGFAIAGRGISLPGGLGGPDWWILKTNANGDSVWSQIVGGPLEDTCYDMILTATGNYLLVGFSLTDTTREGRAAEISQTGDVVWTQTYSPAVSVVIDGAMIADGGYLLCGSAMPPDGTNDVLVMQIDGSGHEVWHRIINLVPERDDVATAIQPDGDGGCYVLGHGYRTGTTEKDVFVLHLSSCGDSLRTTWIGNGVDEEVLDAGITPSGILVTAGVARLPGNQNELQGYGIRTDTCNARPCRFDRVLPVDSTSLSFVSPLTFTWEHSLDMDGDPVAYIFHLESNCPYPVQPSDTVTSDTLAAIRISIPTDPLDELFDFHWRVWATDGIDTVEALNGEGYFRMDIPQSAGEADFHPASFSLSVFPNPFNAVTRLSFSLSASEHVSLAVFDLQGRLVRSLINERRNAGTHDIAVDGGGLASGIYFARLETGSISATRKLMLLK